MVTAAGPVLTAAAPGFSRALAGTGPVFLAFLAVHVLAGLTAVISGALAATAPKRRGRHTRAGTVYYRAITALFATAAAMTAMRPARDWYLALGRGPEAKVTIVDSAGNRWSRPGVPGRRGVNADPRSFVPDVACMLLRSPLR
jgi:hypothetical protein